eukprot:178850-Rhodomonas_salina.1
MHAAKLHSTLVADFPNFTSTPTQVWTAEDVCDNDDAPEVPPRQDSPVNIADAYSDDNNDPRSDNETDAGDGALPAPDPTVSSLGWGSLWFQGNNVSTPGG